MAQAQARITLHHNGSEVVYSTADLARHLQLHSGASNNGKLNCSSTDSALQPGVLYVEVGLTQVTPLSSGETAMVSRRGRRAPPALMSLSAAVPMMHYLLQSLDKKIQDLPGWASLTREEQTQLQDMFCTGRGAHSKRALVTAEAAPVQIKTEPDSGRSDKTDTLVEVRLSAPGAAAAAAAGKSNKVSAAIAPSSKETLNGVEPRGGHGNARAQQPSTLESEPAGKDEDMLDDFERKRREQIERNRRFMASLELKEAGAAVAAVPTKPAKAQKQKEKGLAGSKRAAAAVDLAERRVSLRVRGVQADPILSSGVEDTQRGGVVLAADAGVRSIWAAQRDGSKAEGETVNSSGISTGGGGLQMGSIKAKDKRNTGPTEFTTDNGTDSSDAAFLAYLRNRFSDQPTKRNEGSVAANVITTASVKQLQLREGDVAKLTKRGTSLMAWHPSEGELLLAAGDKEGQLALWQVDYQSQDRDDFDGVACFSHVHTAYVSSVVWASRPGSSITAANHLLTTSYDGTIRLLDVHEGKFLDYTKGVPEAMEISACDVDCHSGVAYLGDSDGELQIVDLKSGKLVRPGIVTNLKRINCIHVEPVHRHLMLTAGSDATVRVWDIRMLGPPPSDGAVARTVPVYELHHKQSCHGAYFAPDGSQRVVSTSFDDSVRIWQLSKATTSKCKPVTQPEPPCVSIHHDNQTGRWVTPFRAVWGANSDLIAVGCMKRGIDLYNASSGVQLQASFKSEFMTAIPSRLAAHPCQPVLAAATSSGRVHIWH